MNVGPAQALGGRTALVTGASSGLGRRCAELLAGHGARVVVGARRTDRLEELRDAIVARGGSALPVALDVCDEASVVAAFEAAERVFGPVDSVVAAAGVSRPASALDLAAADFDLVLAANLRGAFLTAREAARRMIADDAPRRGHGRILMISSPMAHYVAAGMSAYIASKAGLTQMSRALAKEWVSAGVNVNVLAPGFMTTGMTEPLLELDPVGARQLLDSFPRGRSLDMTALEPLIVYLCSDASAAVTGSVFTIDDGQTL